MIHLTTKNRQNALKHFIYDEKKGPAVYLVYIEGRIPRSEPRTRKSRGRNPDLYNLLIDNLSHDPAGSQNTQKKRL